MLRHPSENFIKFLMTSPATQANDLSWVTYTIVSLGFPKPDPDYLAWLKAELDATCPWNFQPGNRYHRDSQKFLKDHSIWALHHPDKATKESNLIVTNLRARPMIENLLLGRMDPKDIAKRINARLGEFFTAEAIGCYSHYYWNVGILKVEDWTRLLQDYEVQRRQTVAILQVGSSMALHKMGFSQEIESKTMIKEMLEGVYFDFREWKAQPLSPAKTKAITTLAKAATVLDVQLSQADSALKESLKAFEQFRMQTATEKVPDVKDLAPGGNYSGSGARLLEAPIEKEAEAKK